MSDLLILIGLFPGILITALSYFFLDRRFKSSIPPIFVYFILGVLISLIAYFIEKEFSSAHNLSLITVALKEAFLLVALPEELTKFVFFLSAIYIFKKWNIMPSHILLFGMIISLGFASLENVLYSYRYGISTSIVRFFTAVPAHAFFGMIIGAGSSLLYFRLMERKPIIIISTTFLLAILAHGLYDFFIIQNISETLLLGAIVCIVIFIIIAVYLVKVFRRFNTEVSNRKT